MIDSDKIFINLIFPAVIGILIFIASFFISEKIFGTEVEIEPVQHIEDRMFIVDYKWERAGRTNCRYDIGIKGFQPIHPESNRKRSFVVFEDCDFFEKGDTLLILKK
jgi:hypothetical protein